MTTDGLSAPYGTLLLAQESPAAVPGPVIPGAPGGTGAPLQQQPGSPGAPGQGQPGGGFGSMIWPLLLIMVLFILFTSLSGRKERKKRAEMLGGLSRNDRVQTIGGIIGTVIELSNDEMVLRVDEASNTRVRFARSAVQQVLRPSKDRDKGRENGPDVEVKANVPTRV